jgi:glycine betaine/choline ABC-type transport system substrate-binding protein
MSLLAVLALFLAFTVTTLGGAAQDDLPTVTVGSKDFTEQILVSEMLAQLLEDAGYSVERQLNLGGSALVHQALVSGEIDTYVEYTGTGLLAILELPLPAAGATPEAGGTPVSIVDSVYDTVKQAYQDEFGLVWLDPLGFNNTYTLAMRSDQAAELGVETISDLITVDADLRFGATQEFVVRPDGLPGLLEAYPGLEFTEALGMDPGLVYEALDSEQVDVISAFATDGRIPALNFVTLEDDLGFFPPYFAAPVVRQELLDEDPEVAEVLNQLSGMIDDQTMADLNFRVDDGGEEAADVAAAFLAEQGLIDAP